jgi:hypothetical protein
MTLPIMEFMRRFLQHVLPRGFMKVRYYGFLSPPSSVSLADVKACIEMASGFAAPEAASEPPAALRCRYCGGALRFYRVVLPGDSAIGWLASLGQRAGESPTSTSCRRVPDPRGPPSASAHRASSAGSDDAPHLRPGPATLPGRYGLVSPVPTRHGQRDSHAGSAAGPRA